MAEGEQVRPGHHPAKSGQSCQLGHGGPCLFSWHGKLNVGLMYPRFRSTFLAVRAVQICTFS